MAEQKKFQHPVPVSKETLADYNAIDEQLTEFIRAKLADEIRPGKLMHNYFTQAADGTLVEKPTDDVPQDVLDALEEIAGPREYGVYNPWEQQWGQQQFPGIHSYSGYDLVDTTPYPDDIDYYDEPEATPDDASLLEWMEDFLDEAE